MPRSTHGKAGFAVLPALLQHSPAPAAVAAERAFPVQPPAMPFGRRPLLRKLLPLFGRGKASGR